jgi:hypothetical protein
VGPVIFQSDLALLIVAAGGLFATFLAIVRDTRDRQRSLGSAFSA